MKRLKDKIKTIKADFGDLKGHFRVFDGGKDLQLEDMIPYKYSINGIDFSDMFVVREYINNLYKIKERRK